MSLLINPILSVNTMRDVATLNPTLKNANLDTVQIDFILGTNDYAYYIEKRRWLIVRLLIFGDIRYEASYFYDDSAGVPALATVAISGDTSLSSGGMRFKNIRINKPLAVLPQAQSRAGHSLSVALTSNQVVFHLGDPDLRFNRMRIHDLQGRVVFSGDIKRTDGTLVVRRGETEHANLPSKVYVAEFEGDIKHRAFTFSWPQ